MHFVAVPLAWQQDLAASWAAAAALEEVEASWAAVALGEAAWAWELVASVAKLAAWGSSIPLVYLE